ncbi:MAG: DUF2164 domain-containing protein [Deltaproteobacteria bacterium]|nr:DUF2164 domain-containing protein [Deltaproteobacteria bacterium]
MSKIVFSKAEQEALVARLKLYFSEELNRELGGFEAQFLLDFIAQEIGPSFYNRGLYDAQAVFASKIEGVTDAIYEIEKPTGLGR